MDIVGDRKFVEIPGDKNHELPPLLVRAAPHVKRMDKVLGMASALVESEDLLTPPLAEGIPAERDWERRRLDLAVNLADQYLSFVQHWQWGHAIVEWIRQCEITFGARLELRHLLRGDVWPHAGRCSFVTLLADKAVRPQGVGLEEAVGLRLTFRQPPPISCFSDQFLFFLNGSLGNNAYQTWAGMIPAPVSCLPPERFQFDVVTM